MITARIKAPIGNPVFCMTMDFAETVVVGVVGVVGFEGSWTLMVTDASVGYKLGSKVIEVTFASFITIPARSVLYLKTSLATAFAGRLSIDHTPVLGSYEPKLIESIQQI